MASHSDTALIAETLFLGLDALSVRGTREGKGITVMNRLMVVLVVAALLLGLANLRGGPARAQARDAGLPSLFKPGAVVVDPQGQVMTVAEVSGEWIRIGPLPGFTDLSGPARWM